MNSEVSGLESMVCEHEGVMLEGRVAVPAGEGPFPAVLVVHNAFGLGGHIPAIARRLAAEGYLALAVDMYGAGAYSEDTAEIAKLVAPLWGNAPRLRARMDAWLAALRGRPDVQRDSVAAIGYCFGGQCVLEHARGGADLRAVVSFHGILPTQMPAQPGAVRAFVSVHTGALDPHAPPAHVQALREEQIAAGAQWQIGEYGDAYHAFTDPSASAPEIGRAYDAVADSLSWSSTLGLLSACLKDPQPAR
jgi:dienelactone hydrolase